jgi:WD40 repeat protein
VTGIAITLAVAAAVIAGQLSHQHAKGEDVAKLSGPDFKPSGELHDPSGVPISAVGFSPDGRTLALADVIGSISVWNVASGQMTGAVTDPGSDGIHSMAFSPDGRTLAVGDDNGTAYLWNMTSMSPSARIANRGCDRVSGVVFNANGRSLLVGCGDGSVYQWQTATRPATVTPLTAQAEEVALAFSSDGSTMAGVDEAGQIYVMDTATGRRMPAHFGLPADSFDSIAFSADGRMLAGGTRRGRVRLWSLSGHLIASRTDPDSAAVRSVAFSPDGRTIAAGNGAGTAYLWKIG